jgi:hypothetical protein
MKQETLNPSAKPKRARGRPGGLVVAGGLRKRAWRTMRHLHTEDQPFTLDQLLCINASGAERDAPSNLLKYLAVLERHGVITRLARRAPGAAPTSPGHVVWCLNQDLGWEAPFWRAALGVLWNPNTQTPVALPERGQP